MLYYNGGNVARLLPVLKNVVLLALGVLIIFVLGYGFWLSRQLGAITVGIVNISQRTYKPLKETGTFGKFYAALNKMDVEIKLATR